MGQDENRVRCVVPPAEIETAGVYRRVKARDVAQGRQSDRVRAPLDDRQASQERSAVERGREITNSTAYTRSHLTLDDRLAGLVARSCRDLANNLEERQLCARHHLDTIEL